MISDKILQGYHDVAITFLLVVGYEMSFYVVEKLSRHHFYEAMRPTMEPTYKRLLFVPAIVRKENEKIADYMEK